MQEVVLLKEQENKRTGFIISIIAHIIMFLLLLIPCLSHMDPPLNEMGIMVMFGEPDAGETPAEEAPMAASSEAEAKETPTEKPVEATPAKFVKAVETPKEEPVEKVVESETSEAFSEVISKPEKAKPKVEPKKEPAKEVAEKEVKKEVISKPSPPTKSAAELEAERKQKEYNDAKSKFGDMFNKNKSSSNSGSKPGTPGDPLGSPDAKVLDGITSGSGRIGGGLSNRGVVSEPNFKDNTQKKGIVVIKICVNNQGKVISGKFTQKGSTTTDAYLVGLAEKEVKKYQFTPSDIEEQCGTITVDFKLQ